MYMPVQGARISSRYEGGFRSTGGHSGIDFAAPSGSAIRAVVPGRVISVGWGGAYGNLVKVRHNDGSIGYYAHMSRTAARPGMTVGRGSLLGYVGSTGNSTGPHAHFEVRQNGKPVNPMSWLDRDYRGGGGGGGLSPGSYGGVKLNNEQLRNAQTIMQVGFSMGASQRDIIIGLMAAMQESNLRNLNYGDRDSLGLFQQRAGWGSASQRTNPMYAARKFFDALLKVNGRGSMGLSAAAQAVQRSAFPDAYAKWEELARALAGNPNAGMYAMGDQFFSATETTYRDPEDIFASMQMDLSQYSGVTPTFEDPATSLMEFEDPSESFVPEREPEPEAAEQDIEELEPDVEEFRRTVTDGFRAV